MEVTSAGFLYVANTTADSISGYSINETTGALTPLASSPFAAADVTAFAIDGYLNLYASGENGKEIFPIGPMGELTIGSPVASSAATALTLVEP